MLLLAIHRVESESAKVPLSMIILLDYVKRKSLPPDLKCRVVLPCGDVSASVWDAPSQAALQEWMEAYLTPLEPGLVNTCHEVQEDFSYGLSIQLAQLRTAEKVAAGSRTALDRISQGASKAGDSIMKQWEAFDKKTVTTLLSDTADALRTSRATSAPPEYPGATAAADSSLGGDRLSTAMNSFSAGVSSTVSWFSSKVKAMQAPTTTEPATHSRPTVGTLLPEDSLAPTRAPPGRRGGPLAGIAEEDSEELAELSESFRSTLIAEQDGQLPQGAAAAAAIPAPPAAAAGSAFNAAAAAAAVSIASPQDAAQQQGREPSLPTSAAPVPEAEPAAVPDVVPEPQPLFTLSDDMLAEEDATSSPSLPTSVPGASQQSDSLL